MSRTKVREDEVLLALSKRHPPGSDLWYTHVKNGPTQLARPGGLRIMDGLGIAKSWANPSFHGYEVKVSRSDFIADEKWPIYMNYCHQFSFVCPKGLIQPDELPPDVGLIWYNPETRSLYTKRRARKRLIDISWDMLFYILISRTESDRHPYFSNRAEELRAWLQIKDEKRHIGHLVSKRMKAELEQAAARVAEAERTAETFRQNAEAFDEIRSVMRRHGVTAWRTKDLAESLDSALMKKAPPGLEGAVRDVYLAVQRIEKIYDHIQRASGEP